jgi:hypothetical protein
MYTKEEEAAIQELLPITKIITSQKEGGLYLILKGLCVKSQELFSRLWMEKLTINFKMQ